MHCLKPKIKRKNHSGHGFTLVEVILVAGLLVTVVAGLLLVFIYCSILAEHTRGLTLAITEAQTKFEEIRDHAYAQIPTDYGSGGTPGNKFDLSGATGKGVIYIDSTDPDLLKIKIVICWRSQNGRVVGEDTDLDGTLDAGENDPDGDGEINSPATFISWIAKR